MSVLLKQCEPRQGRARPDDVCAPPHLAPLADSVTEPPAKDITSAPDENQVPSEATHSQGPRRNSHLIVVPGSSTAGFDHRKPS
ncbi:hypothetical protein K490DRAFT_62756 [Saccharata proteae CBS 121410]|uniref:Uncharacterized protein n=1 Tax=Saccharata proteae CBS 121410 TaxID=1314787 RepID=A0A9P4LY39_9PEZI|nr:hypothetical protein K490DRAFT_62756 [Saccharata proteae CBS 121410]